MGISTTPSKIAKLADQAYAHYLASQMVLMKGPHPDWVKFSREMKALDLSLQKLVTATKQKPAK